MAAQISLAEKAALETQIIEFQSYIADQHARRTRSWSHAQVIVQGIAETLAGAVSNAPPTNLQMAAACLGVGIFRNPTSRTNYHGSLVPVPGGFHATVYTLEKETGQQPDLSEQDDEHDLSLALDRRGRFTLAHELGHVLFYQMHSRSQLPRRVVPAPPKRGQDAWREEGLCHAFARALLLPTLWRSGVGKVPTFRNLIEASSLFRISGEALLHRILYDWKQWRSAIIIHAQIPTDQQAVRLFRGADRATDKTFTRTHIQEAIAGAATPEEAVEFLIRRLRFSRRQILLRPNSFWALV